MRAAVYVRQSLDRTGEGLGVERQCAECQKLAAARGWSVADSDVIVENGVSASTAKRRPGYDRLLGMIDRREVDVIVCWAADRIARKLTDLEDLIERCERTGVRLATVSGDIDLSTDAGRLVARILTSVARAETERKGARHRLANAQAAKAGKPYGGGPVPFGFRDVVTRDDGGRVVERRRELERAQADAIRTAYRQVLDGGSVESIAKQWNRVGLTSGKMCTGRRAGTASQWTGKTVRVLLGKARNAALREHEGQIVGPAAWPAIVSEDVWRAAVAELDGRQARETRPRNVRRLLSGVARCGRCGGIINAGTSYRGRHSYRCRESLGHVGRRGDHADEYVGAVVVERLARPDAVDLLAPQQRDDVDQLRTEAAALRSRLDGVAVEFADDVVTAGQLRTITERTRAKLADVEQRLADAGRTDVVGPLVLADDVLAVWDAMTVDHRRAVVEALMTVTLHPVGQGARRFDPDSVEITWKGSE